MFIVLGLHLLTTLVLADVVALDPLARPSTKLGPTYEVSLSISVNGIDEDELCKRFVLDNEGRLQLKLDNKPIEKIPLLGKTTAQAKDVIARTIQPYFVATPEVRIGISRIPRFRVIVTGSVAIGGSQVLADGAHLEDALLKSNPIPQADLSKVLIDRTTKEGARQRYAIDFSKAARGELDDSTTNPALFEGDFIYVNATAKMETARTVGVHGEVRVPGFYAYKPGMKVNDAILEAFGLTANADADRVTILRGKQFLTINAERAKRGVPTDDLDLLPDDIVTVATKDQSQKYAVLGLVAAPTSIDYKGKPTLKQAIAEAGGFKPEADRKAILLIRGALKDPSHSQSVIIDFDRVARGEAPDVPLNPGDVVQVLPKKKGANVLMNVGLFILRRFIPF